MRCTAEAKTVDFEIYFYWEAKTVDFEPKTVDFEMQLEHLQGKGRREEGYTLSA